jgi:hypothetical protein
METLRSSDIGEVAFRAVEADSPNTWLIVVVDSGATEVGDALSKEVAALDEEDAPVIPVSTPADFELAARDHRDGVLIIPGADFFSDDDWRWLDLGRSRFQRNGTTVMVMREEALGKLEGQAPNFASWIGGNVWRLRSPKPLDAEGVEERLLALRSWSGLTDAQVIRKAEERTLPPDPPFAEWLVLLGRGDLLVR